jgi:type IV pilus assembly protein PilX
MTPRHLADQVSLHRRYAHARPERGVVLIICLLFLLLISITAAVSVRGASSSEAVANNSRTQALAMQAAEAALGYCEKLVTDFVKNGTGKAPPSAPVAGDAYGWESLANWDGAGTDANVQVVPFADSQSGSDTRYFKRSPECMAQYYLVGKADTAIITARGFGPDVAAADNARSAPKGAEVWLQSVLTLP